MLPLAATNTVGAVLFGTLYVVASLRSLPSAVFLACLGMLFVLVTVLWVRVEAGLPARRGGVARLGRAAAGLLAAVIGLPVVVLMPLFWLDDVLPAEAGLRPLVGPIMTLVLIVLVLVALTNLAGGTLLLGRRFAGQGRPEAPRS